jgi:hypothetical protein
MEPHRIRGIHCLPRTTRQKSFPREETALLSFLLIRLPRTNFISIQTLRDGPAWSIGEGLSQIQYSLSAQISTAKLASDVENA